MSKKRVLHEAGPVSDDRTRQRCARCALVLCNGSGPEWLDGYGIIGIRVGAAVEWASPVQFRVVDGGVPNCELPERRRMP